MTDSEFLYWLADRLVKVYGESENVDFVLKTRHIAKFIRLWNEIPLEERDEIRRREELSA